MSAAASASPAKTKSGDTRPILAVVANEITPYRVHFHRRLAAEIPEFQLRTLLCRDSAWSAWKHPDLPEIGLVKLAEGELARAKGRVGYAMSQRRRAASAVSWLSTHDVGAVIVNGWNESFQRASIRWCLANKVPFMVCADSNIKSDTVTGLKRTIKNFMLPRFLSRIPAIICCGSLGRAYFRRYGVPDDRIFYSPYEPDYEQLEKLDPAIVREVSARYSLRPERKRFVVSSRLVSFKRVDLAIDAFCALADQLPQWDLIVLGGGPMLDQLKAKVPDGLRSRVTITGFIGRQEDVTAVYRVSHVLIHPSNYEPWALVINEAAGAGLAIISTDVVGAAAELVRDGVNGRIVPADDLEALKAAMLDVATSDRLEAMRRASIDVLAAWRREADPVGGVRKALRKIGALTTP